MRVIVPQLTWHQRDRDSANPPPVPVLSIDFDPSCNGEDGFYRVATGGGELKDNELLIWRISNADTVKPDVNCVAALNRHEKGINVVRFSPDGKTIASGGDDAYILLWKCGEKKEKENPNPESDSQSQIDSQGQGKERIEENWVLEKALRKHCEDVSDLSWSPDGNFLVSGAIDKTAVLWDVKKATAIHVWSEKEHGHFIHGVSYDPLNEFIATMCLDRNLRMFDRKTSKLAFKALKYPDSWIAHEINEDLEKENIPERKKKAKARKSASANEDGEGNTTTTSNSNSTDGNGEVEVAEAEVEVEEKKKPSEKGPFVLNRLFLDEFLPSYCRRMSFSPRGELLLVPGGALPPGQSPADPKMNMKLKLKESEEEGQIQIQSKKKAVDKANNNAVMIFCRHSWTTPCAVIPTLDSFSVGARFCPVYFNKERKPYKYDEEVLTKNDRRFACIGKLAQPKEDKEYLMKMPYRLVYAVATNNTVLIGDTASPEPLAVIRSIHLGRITDISWTSNGRAIMVSSLDGYCSIITFEKGELGEEFPLDDNFPQIQYLNKECFPIPPPEPKKEPVKREKKPKTPKSNATPNVSTNGNGAGAEGETNASANAGSTTNGSGADTPKTTKGKKPKTPGTGTGEKTPSGKKPIPKKAKTPVSVLLANAAKTSPKPKATATTTTTSTPKAQNGNGNIEENEKAETEVAIAAPTPGQGTPNTPKTAEPKRITLEKWFTKTPKSEDSDKEKEKAVRLRPAPNPGSSSASTSSDGGGPPKLTPVTPIEIEVLTIDDDSNSQEPEPPKIYAMTPPPPIAKPIAVKKRASLISLSPLTISSSSGGSGSGSGSPLAKSASSSSLSGSNSKKRPVDVSPEELHKLTTAPIKCRRIMEEPKVIMESSPRTRVQPSPVPVATPAEKSELATATTITTITQSLESNKDNEKGKEKEIRENVLVVGKNPSELPVPVPESQNVKDTSCPTPAPASPVASNTPKKPRRITLTTLCKPATAAIPDPVVPTTNTNGNGSGSGKLD